jgi:hypothetical protein
LHSQNLIRGFLRVCLDLSNHKLKFERPTDESQYPSGIYLWI